MNAAPLPVASVRDVAVAALGLALPGHAGTGTALLTPGLVAALRATPSASDAALMRMADLLGSSDVDLLAFAMLAAIELDPALARAVGAAQAPVAGSRATLGLLAAALAPFGADLAALAFGPAVRIGLLAIGDEPAALPERTVFPHLPTLAALGGRAQPWEDVAPRDADTLPLPAEVVRVAGKWAAALGTGGGLAVRAATRREAIAAAGHVAAAMGASVATCGAARAGLAPWLLATGALPLFSATLGPGEQWRVPSIAGWTGAWFVAIDGEGAAEADDLRGDWTVPPPGPAERVRLWRAGGVPATVARRAGTAFRHGPARIADAAARAGVGAAARGAARIGWGDVTGALHAHGGRLDALAERIRGQAGDGALVLDAAQDAALAALADRCRLREGLGDGLGPAITGRYRPGVRALLHGPSGTGKTLAASWLAAALAMPLYRVDLAALTSKWIGETEKNVSAVLDAAADADVVLFFDEADALFAARSDGGEANDRFANAQTNHLLQRIESFAGIALLASNARDRFDPAFLRRLDAVIAFDPPGAAARRRLWHAHLGDDHALDAAMLDRLAVAVELPGGHIRNVVLAAAAAARAASRALGWADIVAAIGDENAKLGRPPPGLA